jgi:hypothetical protein
LDRDEALAKFVRDHYKELTDTRASKTAVKQLRQRFFEQNKLAAGSRFSNYDVAIKVARDVSRIKKNLTEEEIRSLLRSIPLVAEELESDDIQLLVTKEKLGSGSALTPSDLKKLREDEYLATLEAQFRAKAEAEAQTRLEKERLELERMRSTVLQQQQSLAAFQSALDSIAPTADLEKLVEKEETPQPDRPFVIWWKELGLDGDPFASNQGLLGIPEGKYDEVVVPTPFIRSYLERLSQAPEQLLGKTIIILGEFGSGKTTLLQLIAHRAATIGLLPVVAFLNPQGTLSKMTGQFVSQVTEGVGRASAQRLDELSGTPLHAMDEIGLCIKVMEGAARSAASKGFLICVDGLHKPETYLKQSLEFLQQLQSFQERLSHAKIPCGILVAGSPAWEVEILSNPSLSGSFYGLEKVPPLAEESAVESVVRRIHSFVPSSRPRPTIVKAPLRRAFGVLSKRLLRPPTFRDYLDHVRNRFIARDYSSVGISLALHTETIEAVQREVANSPLGISYGRLYDPKQHTTHFRRALKIILPEMYIRKGIPESDPLFQVNKGAFYLLRKEGFIVPRANAANREFVWHLSQKIVELLQKSYEEHKIPPEDALEAMFSDRIVSLPQEAETIYGHIRKQLEIMIASWRSGWPEVTDLLEKANSKIRQVEKASENIDGLISPETLENLKLSLQNMMRAAAFVVGDPQAMRGEISRRFGDLWCAPENVDSWVELLQRTEVLPRNPSECFGILHLHAQAISDLSVLLTNLIRGEGVTRLANRLLTTTELARLHEARTMFLAQRYAGSVDALCGLVEAKIRDVVFPSIRCGLGPKAVSLLPEDIRQKIGETKGHPRAKRVPDPNFLYNVSRSEYSKVMFQRELHKIIFGILLESEIAAEVKDSLELLFSLGDREAHRDKPTYFREHSTEIVDCLKMAPRVCELMNRIADRLLTGPEFQLRTVDDSTLIYSFGTKANLFENQQMDANVVEGIVFEILQGLEGGPLVLPPLEIWIGALHCEPEQAIAILRGCVENQLVQVERPTDGFGLWYSINVKGTNKLSSLRRRYSLMQTQDPAGT